MENRKRLDLGIPDTFDTEVGEMLSVAGLIEMARTSGTEQGHDLYDAFSEAWDYLRDSELTNDQKANLAFDVAAEMAGCPLRPEADSKPH